jgi:hypothetical protein
MERLKGALLSNIRLGRIRLVKDQYLPQRQ